MSASNVIHDQLLIPMAGGSYETFPMAQLLGTNTNRGISNSSFGLAPLHFITQRGPYQDGETVTDMRFDPRTIQIIIGDAFSSRHDMMQARQTLLNMVRPNRSFNRVTGNTNPLIYRRRLSPGAWERGSDLVTENGSPVVTSDYGKFIHNGLTAGMNFTITTGADAGSYGIANVRSDYALVLDANMAAAGTGVGWRYQHGYAIRDLYCLLESGPNFDEEPLQVYYPYGYKEVLRLIAHDPFWYGGAMDGQYQQWDLLSTFNDLVFDGYGAWFGATIEETSIVKSGRWLFYTGTNAFIGETVNVVYWGTAVAKPQVVITGPATNPTVTNTTTGHSISMDYSIPLNETVTIDTLTLTVTNQTGANLLPYVSGDLATFGIFPSPQALDRKNQIFINFDDAEIIGSAAQLLWRNRYVGI